MLDQEFNIKSSKQFLWLILTIWVATAVICFHLPMSKIWQWLGFCLSSVYMGSVFLHRNAITAIKFCANGQCELKTLDKIYTATLAQDCTLTPWVSVLRFHLPSRLIKKSRVIFCDSMAVNEYRQLLVKCRYPE